MLNEYGLFERSLIVAGKELGVSTVAIQHGMINSHHRGYMYSRDEVSPVGSFTAPYCPIPDRTAVYGPYYKHLLTKVSSYPEDRVIVTGAPSYDRIARLSEIYSKKDFAQRYNIEGTRRTLLWTTQCHGLSMSENTRNFEAVLSAMRHLSKTTLLIKQHPGEGRKYTEMIKDFLAKYDVNAILAPADSDLHEQLYSCDLMISKHSTSIIEAVAADKPVIILNLTKEIFPEGSDYVTEGVAVEVQWEQDLVATIRKLLDDSTELSRNRRRFVEKYLFGLDGKATQRAVSLIWGMARNSIT
jgi:UDP-N-acetylglucosamine 2-epimerase